MFWPYFNLLLANICLTKIDVPKNFAKRFLISASKLIFLKMDRYVTILPFKLIKNLLQMVFTEVGLECGDIKTINIVTKLLLYSLTVQISFLYVEISE